MNFAHPKQNGWSIRTKFITLAVAAILPCGFIAHLAVTEAAQRQFNAEEMTRALTAARQAIWMSRSLLLFDNQGGVQAFMKAISLDPSSTAAALYGPTGGLVGGFGKREPARPQACLPSPAARREPAEILVASIISDSRGAAGCLVISRSQQANVEHFRRVHLFAFLILPLFTAIVGAGLYRLLGHVICEPLLRLRASTDALRQGQFPEPLSVQANDEIGALTHDFDTMVSRLHAASGEQRELIAKLEQSTMQAQAAARSKSAFLANMSHEIRTPMNAILGMTALAMDAPAGPEQQEYLTTVKAAGTWLLELLNDILDLANSEAGKLDLAYSNFSLERAVAGAVAPLKARAEQQGLRFSCCVSSEPALLFGDDRRLRQILTNLLGNAVKFTDSGEVRVKVTQESVGDGTATLHFTVSDTGIGVPASKQQLIFMAFEQADGSATRRFGGTGLGLAISAELVKKMNGKIWVESPWFDTETGALVDGSTFHVTVQFRLGKQPEFSQPEARPAPVPPMRILLAEDNPVNQMLMLRLLSKQGHNVTVAADGVETLEALTQTAVDLILMDVQMPRMDGLETASRIREQEKASGSHVPIVALTAHALEGDDQRCRVAGMDDYLSKPVRLDHLNKVIGRFAHAAPLPR